MAGRSRVHFSMCCFVCMFGVRSVRILELSFCVGVCGEMAGCCVSVCMNIMGFVVLMWYSVDEVVDLLDRMGVIVFSYSIHAMRNASEGKTRHLRREWTLSILDFYNLLCITHTCCRFHH